MRGKGIISHLLAIEGLAAGEHGGPRRGGDQGSNTTFTKDRGQAYQLPALNATPDQPVTLMSPTSDTRKETGRGNKTLLSQNDKSDNPLEPKHNTQAEIAKAANTSKGVVTE